MDKRSSHSKLVFILLACFTFAIYAPGAWWGAPHATAPDRKLSWGVDDETPLGPLAEIHNIISPKADRNLGYPLMYSFVVAGAYGPYLGYLWLSNQWTHISGTYPFGLSNPVETLKILTYIAHFVTVLMGVGVILAAFETGRVLKNKQTGIFAALFAASSYPMFYYVRTGNVDVPMLFFAALAVMVFARCIALGYTTQRAIWLGIFAGFALATKEQSIAIFLAIPFVLLVYQYREDKGARLGWQFWRPSIIGLFAAFLALGLGSGLFIEPGRYLAHLDFTLGHMEQITQGTIYVPHVYPFTLEGNLGYLHRVTDLLAEMMSWPGMLLGLAGLVLALFRNTRVRSLSIIILVYLIFIFFTLRSPQMRYFIPASYLLALPAAWLVISAWEHKNTVLRWSTILLGAGIVSFNMLRGAGLTYEMVYDSRHAAAEWLAANTAAGDTIEHFGPTDKLPPLKSGVTTKRATFYGGIYTPARMDDDKVREILRGWQLRQPRYILLIPDMTSRPGADYSSTCPPQLCEALLDGSAGFPLAASFKTDPLFPDLTLPALDYPTVNPPIRVYSMPDQTAS